MNLSSIEAIARAYRQDGFAIVPGVLCPEQTQPLLKAIEAIQSSLSELPEEQLALLVMERDLPAVKRAGLAPREVGDAIFIIGEPPAFDYRFAEWLLSPLLIELVRQLLQWRDIRYHLSNVTMKRLQVGSGIAWHRDYPNSYICPADSSFLRLMICLDGMSAENGATEFIPGSHRLSDSEAATANAAQDAAGAKVRAVTAHCPPGSLVFIHPKVVHGGPPNASNGHRRNLIVQWGRGAALNCSQPEILGGYSIDAIQAWVAKQR